jgi:large subunit ribosomal protein L28
LATRCEICGKKPMHGYSVSHSMRHTKRRWLPNVQHATLIINGAPVRVAICTRCLRTHHKAAAAAK